MITESQMEHEKELAVIAARAKAFEKSPLAFTVWDVTRKILSLTFWLCLWFIVAQCSCDGCVL